METDARADEGLIPPERLVAQNEIGAGDFRKIGDAMIRNLIDRGMITRDSNILDIGCGLGRLARPLVGYLKRGTYTGLDINRSSIEWCTSHYASHPDFRFAWLDIYSKFYNPEGNVTAKEYRFPFADNTFDFVMLTSVFTHMMLADVDNYLAEIGRILKRGGKCYATYFLLSRKLSRIFASQSQYFAIEGGFITDKNVPEKVVFLKQDAIRKIYKRHHLRIEAIEYGNWSGRHPESKGYQDEVIAVTSGANTLRSNIGQFLRYWFNRAAPQT